MRLSRARTVHPEGLGVLPSGTTNWQRVHLFDDHGAVRNRSLSPAFQPLHHRDRIEDAHLRVSRKSIRINEGARETDVIGAWENIVTPSGIASRAQEAGLSLGNGVGRRDRVVRRHPV
jgi:hypothetical protein